MASNDDYACLHRPSSWPVRRERRHAAQVQQHDLLVNLVKQVQDDISLMKSTMGPPGLHGAIVETLSQQILDVLRVSIEGTLSAVNARLDRLEPLVVCSPSTAPTVDVVLDHVIAKTHGREPERELSPSKDTKLCAATSEMTLTALHFSIADAATDSAVQASVEHVHIGIQ